MFQQGLEVNYSRSLVFDEPHFLRNVNVLVSHNFSSFLSAKKVVVSPRPCQTVPAAFAIVMGEYISTELGYKAGPRLREHAPRSQREPGSGIQATYRTSLFRPSLYECFVKSLFLLSK